MKAVILAGGKGTRLAPYTTNFPKPLMPINGKPILEIVIDTLRSYGITDIIITTGHLAELIKAFFSNGKRFGVNISYSRENNPLGTAGPLSLISNQLTNTFIVMNGDVLSDINIHDFIDFHQTHKSQATIALCKRTVEIDFGVVRLKTNNQFFRWQEKPIFEYLVSTGIYLFEPEVLQSLDSNSFLNIPEFIMNLENLGMKITGYLHQGYWLDIGRPEDYAKACNDYEAIYNER